jgi:hypothetical protein
MVNEVFTTNSCRVDSAGLWISGNMRLADRGVRGMPYYRLYFMDRFSGHIDHFREFEAEKDSAACKKAEAWRGSQPMELWRLHRKRKHWDAEPVFPD